MQANMPGPRSPQGICCVHSVPRPVPHTYTQETRRVLRNIQQCSHGRTHTQLTGPTREDSRQAYATPQGAQRRGERGTTTQRHNKSTNKGCTLPVLLQGIRGAQGPCRARALWAAGDEHRAQKL